MISAFELYPVLDGGMFIQPEEAFIGGSIIILGVGEGSS